MPGHIDWAINVISSNIILFVSAKVTPFKLTVVTDENEVFGGTAAGAINEANVNEASANAANSNFPLGTMGFSLTYIQQACSWFC